MITIFVLIFICLVVPRRVHAYIDPGTGNYLLQIIMAALFGALFAIKVFWTKIKGMLAGVQAHLFKQKQHRMEE